jgi:chemotaxis protein CheD
MKRTPANRTYSAAQPSGSSAAAGRPSPVYLLPGALHCEPEPSVVTTVLGSCVAVCLSDRGRQLSGINHFVLPRSGGDPANLRYGDVSIDRLVEAMLRLGGVQRELEAKLFGGAAVLSTNAPYKDIGTQNVEIAVERLASLGIPIVARRTGGKTGMAIRLFTHSGEVHVRRIGSSAARQANSRALGAPT